MQRLTFPGFLKRYVAELSTDGTLRLSVLVADVKNGNARLLEPLTLYAVCAGKSEYYYKLLDGAGLREKVPEAASIEQFICGREVRTLPFNYLKVRNSYLSEANKQKNDDVVKSLVRDRVIRIQKEKKISNYRIYTDLRLNPGNVNAWLKTGDEKKIALNTSRRILEFVEHYDH